MFAVAFGFFPSCILSHIAFNLAIFSLHHRVSLVPQAGSAVKLIRSFLGRSIESGEGRGLQQQLSEITNQLDLLDLNYALYRCDAEERDDGHGGGCYVVPGAGALVYCGLQGIMSMLVDIRDNNDLGHPLCDNLRDGDWMAGYTVNRLRLKTGTKHVSMEFVTWSPA